MFAISRCRLVSIPCDAKKYCIGVCVCVCVANSAYVSRECIVSHRFAIFFFLFPFKNLFFTIEQSRKKKPSNWSACRNICETPLTGLWGEFSYFLHLFQCPSLTKSMCYIRMSICSDFIYSCAKHNFLRISSVPSTVDQR